MRQQYLSVKSQYPDCILLFRLGDFYETFDEDAKTVARVCDIVLTSRPVGNDQRVPLAGVPYHAIDFYIAKLVEAGYRVAIAEQISEPGKGLVEREVRRVVSKGTIVDPGMLDERRNNYLMAVAMGRRGATAGIAYCDITTGEFAATQITAAGPEELEQRIGDELSRLQPSELIPIDWEPAARVDSRAGRVAPPADHPRRSLAGRAGDRGDVAQAALRRRHARRLRAARARRCNCARPRACWPTSRRCSPACATR
jgi:DNA mismatch repair protein MutS